MDIVRAPTPPTRLVILGQPVAQSLSPRFQNAALIHAGLPQRYEALDVSPARLVATLAQLAREGAGGNVTMPHKQTVFTLATRTSALAARVGAVNTFWFHDDSLIGHNTDVAGVLSSIRALVPDGLDHACCVVLGTGGASAAVLVALDMLGCGDVRVWSRVRERAAQLITRVNVRAREIATLAEALEEATLVVNATPIGMDGVSLPFDVSLLPRACVVSDLIYRRDGTALVRRCMARGLGAEDGRRMLVEQGAEAFRTWFDIEPSLPVMWNAIGGAPTGV